LSIRRPVAGPVFFFAAQAGFARNTGVDLARDGSYNRNRRGFYNAYINRQKNKDRMEKIMKNFSRALAAVAALASVLAALSSAACAPSGAAAAAVTPTPEAAAAATATPAATPSPTPTPSPEPTPIVDEYGFSEERKAELQDQFQAFLNKQGEFTSEKMSLAMMETLSNLNKSEVGLGIVNDVPEIQGYFFDYLEKEGRIFLFMGFDGKDGKRFITPLEIPIYFYEALEPAYFGVREYKENSVVARGENIKAEDYSDDKEKLVSLLHDLKGRVLVFSLHTHKYNESEVDGLGLDPINRDKVVVFIREANSKVELTFGLFQLLPQNKIPPYKNSEKIKSDSESILKLTSPEEMGNINIDQVPIILNIYYFSGELTAGE